MMRSSLLLAALTVLYAASIAGNETTDGLQTRHYDWITAGNVSGSLQVEQSAGGIYVAEFEFNDRGRGPRLRETSQVNERGMLVSLEVTGNAYMGAPVAERFNQDGSTVTWSSTLESGQADSGAYYWPSDGTPLQTALLAKALLNTESHSLELLPAGRAFIETITDFPLGDDSEGKITLYAISGLGFTPEYVWLDEDLDLFAQPHGWMGLAPRENHELLPTLQSLQDEAEQNRSKKLASKLANALPQSWVLENFNLVDVASGTVRPGMSAIIQDGRIVGLIEGSAPKGSESPAASDKTVLDADGQYLIPGLWDMHAHLSLDDGLLNIAAGVTTVRDMANDEIRLNQVRAAFDSGEVIGPHSYRCGFIDKKSPFSAPTGKLAQTLDDALQMIDEYAGKGYPQIKIYSSIEPDWVAPMADAIHGHNMRLSGHIPSYMTAESAVLQGFDEIQHINMLFLNFLAGPEDDTRTPVRFKLVAEKAGSLDLDSDEVKSFIRLLADRGIEVDPTVAIFDSMFRHRSGEVDPSYSAVADHMPAAVRRSMLAASMDVNDENAERYQQSAQALLNMIVRLYEAGVPLVAGTDDIPGFTLHRELELYQQAGIPPAAVLRIATLDSAQLVGAAEESGSIEVGKRADMVLLKENPLEDISAVRRPQMVFKGDRSYVPGELYQAIGITPFN